MILPRALRLFSSAAAAALLLAAVDACLFAASPWFTSSTLLGYLAQSWGVFGILTFAAATSVAVAVLGGELIKRVGGRFVGLAPAASSAVAALAFAVWAHAFWTQPSSPFFSFNHLPVFYYVAGATFVLFWCGTPLASATLRMLCEYWPLRLGLAAACVCLQVLDAQFFHDSIPYVHFRMGFALALVWTFLVFVDVERIRRALQGLLVAMGFMLLARATVLWGPPSRTDMLVRTASTIPRATLLQLQFLCDFDDDGSSAAWCFGGMDTEEWNDEIGPYAWDIPMDGVDQNGMAGDAQPYSVVAAATRPARARNLIWISLDTIRADDARTRLTSLGALRSTGLDFERAYTAQVSTRFSLSSAMSSRLLPATWVPSEYETIGTVLQQAGYLTVAVVGMPIREETAEKRAFFKGFERVTRDSSPTTLARLSRELRHETRPVFLWIHDLGAHMPSIPAASLRAFKTTWRRPEYNRLLGQSDGWLSSVLRSLNSDGWNDDSALVFFSDHGELMGEKGLYFHAKTPYEPLARIPLVVRFPGSRAERRREVVSSIDLAPTSLDLLGIGSPASFQGLSRVGASAKTPALTLASSDIRSPDQTLEYTVVDAAGRWKLVQSTWHNYVQLYDLANDPDEENDLANMRPDLILQMRRIYDSAASEGWPSVRRLRERALGRIKNTDPR